MDALTHLFLPLVVVMAYRPALLDSPIAVPIVLFGLAPDFDKLLGAIGLFHSLLVLVPVGLAILVVSRVAADRGFDRARAYGMVAVLLLGSHLLLDFIDGGPVTLLAPVVAEGVGLEYPMRVFFGESAVSVTSSGPVVRLRVGTPRNCVHPYTPLDSVGVASTLLFVTLYAKWYVSGRPDEAPV